MEQPNTYSFSYNRHHPPLFFSPPTEYESKIWKDSIKESNKEFYRLIKTQKITSFHLMSNGMTIGEYCMLVLTRNHNKRIIGKQN